MTSSDGGLRLMNPKRLLKRTVGIALAVLLGLAPLPSCWHAHQANPFEAASRYALKKRVMLLPILDLAEAGPEMTRDIHAQIKDLLRGGAGLILLEPPQDIWPAGGPPASALIDFTTDLGLIKRSEDLGVHALVGCVLTPPETAVVKAGFWPFRHAVRESKVSILFNVTEVYSRALYATLSESKRVRFPLSDTAGRTDSEILARSLKEALGPILRRVKSPLMKKLAALRWFAPIRSVEEDTLTIDPGQDVGLRPDQTFWVYDQGETIVGKGGRSLKLAGKKIGEVRITAVSETRSTAAVVSGGPFSPGQRLLDVP